MKNREILLELSYEIDKLLSVYVDLHDLRLREEGTLRSLFRRVNFKDIFQTSENLLRDFIREYNKVVEPRDYNWREKDFYDCLYSYFSALLRCLIAFRELTKAQYLRSENKITLPFKKNQELEGEYKKWIDEYYNRGRDMNDKYASLKSNNTSANIPKRRGSLKETTKQLGEALNKSVLQSQERIDNYSLFPVIAANLGEEISIRGRKLNKKDHPTIFTLAQHDPEKLREILKSFQMRSDWFDYVEAYLKQPKQLKWLPKKQLFIEALKEIKAK